MERELAMDRLAAGLRTTRAETESNDRVAVIEQVLANWLRSLARSQPLRILAFKRHSEGMQLRRHQSTRYGGISLHKLSSRLLIGRL
jgi:hypothetical protein